MVVIMKATGIVRKIDQLGRIVLPKGLRELYNIKENKTVMEIYVDGEEIILKKYDPSCVFCEEAKGVINFRRKLICKDCLQDIKESTQLDK